MTKESMQNHTCPICGIGMVFNPRYPRAVCAECAVKTMDEGGRRIEFFNESLSGGLTGQYDDGSNYPGGRCWIDGVECIASDARFGGIVVEVVPEK